MQEYYNQLNDLINYYVIQQEGKNVDLAIGLGVEKFCSLYDIKALKYVYVGVCWVISFIDENRELGMFIYEPSSRREQTEENPFEELW